jgi:pyruvate, orthophosphate dikinase
VTTPVAYVFDFGEADRNDKSLLGGKGAGLAEMTDLGLPVPPGFTITTEACRAMMRDGDPFPTACGTRSTRLWPAWKRRPGVPSARGPVPLLLSVRSGAVFSMPGMMDTVLNLGSNDQVVQALIDWSGDPTSPGTSTGASSRCTGTWC